MIRSVPDYATDWLARRDMISHAETSQGSRHIVNLLAHMARMMKRYGPIYRDAVGAAYGHRRGDRCSAVVCDLIDADLSKRFGWQTIRDLDAASFAAFKARYPIA